MDTGRPEDRLALIELIDRDGRVRRTLDVHAWPVSLGRALDNTLVLDDPHVAPHHATLAPDADGLLQLQVGASRNGVQVGPRRLPAGTQAPLAEASALLQLGGQRLRVRLAGAPVAPELPLARPVAVGRALWAMLAAWVLVQAGHRWLRLDPGADFVEWLPWLLGLPTGLALWCGLWALGSKLFRHGFDFASHAAIALAWLLVWEVLDAVLPLAAAAAGWPLPWLAWRQWGLALITTLLLRAHLRQVLPQHPRAINLGLGLLLVAGIGVNGMLNLRHLGRVFNEPYMSALPPPALRLGGTVPVPALADDLPALHQALQQRAREAVLRDGDEDEPR
ncbi:MAG TPA: FHA domain-containing protein [Aquabacterium sp.]|nr:FHA domain-containing protein [Aquabacterium sp.]HQC97066.1 FHA domain-containing protein [Aquabacterium sp.]